MKVKKTVYSDVDSDEDLEDNTAKDEGWPGGPMLVHLSSLSSFFLSTVTVFALQLIHLLTLQKVCLISSQESYSKERP